jgi:hypothetical protein
LIDFVTGYVRGVRFDVRCAATEHRHADQATGRCQLFAGHEGPHARLQRAADTSRTLHRWIPGEGCSAMAFGNTVPAQLPWAPTFPRCEDGLPATETEPAQRFEPPRLENVGSPPVLPVRRVRSADAVFRRATEDPRRAGPPSQPTPTT